MKLLFHSFAGNPPFPFPISQYLKTHLPNFPFFSFKSDKYDFFLLGFSGHHRSVARVLGRRYFAASTEEYAKRNYANNVSEYNSVVGSLTAQRRYSFFFFLTFLYIHFLTALSLLVCEKTYFSFFSTRLDFYVCILYRHFLLRDVYDDMMLDGVQPTRDVFHSLIVGTMKGVRLQDGFYFKDQMKTTGLLPDVCVFFFLFEL